MAACVKPIVGAESCRGAQLMQVVSGQTGVRMNDGSQAFVGIDVQGESVSAKPQR